MANGRKTRSGGPIESEASVLAIRLGTQLFDQTAALFESHGVTPLQYIFLRVLFLRDPDNEGMSRRAIEERANRSGPEVTRGLDRLEQRGLIERARTDSDRRTVLARLTEAGIALNEAIEGPLVELNRRQFAHMTRDEIETLVGLLTRALAGTKWTAPIEGQRR